MQFNAAVGDDLVISASVLDDLNAARHHAMRTFTNALRKLTPKNAPVSTWSHVHDRQQLADSLEEFIESRADQFRVQGKLIESTLTLSNIETFSYYNI